MIPGEYTNGARWIILVSKSGSLFVMHCQILLSASCALEITSKAIGMWQFEMRRFVHQVQKFLQEMLICHADHSVLVG
jgi:hypothetical protein